MACRLPRCAPNQYGPLLLERFVVGYAPSLTLALHAPRAPDASHTRVAVISDPVYARDDSRLRLAAAADDSAFRGEDRVPSRRFTRLPYSALEARAVTRALGADRTLEISGFDATPARVLAADCRAAGRIALRDPRDCTARFARSSPRCT